MEAFQVTIPIRSGGYAPNLLNSGWCREGYLCRTRPQGKDKRTRRNRQMRWFCQLPARLAEMLQAILREPDQKTRYLSLTKLGDRMVPIPEGALQLATRVSGCNSISHVETLLQNDQTVALRGYSDAKVSRGLVALVVLGLDGCSVSEVLAVTSEEVLSASGLHGSIIPSRIGGLSSILAHVQKLVHALQSTNSRNPSPPPTRPEKHPLDGRWSDRQGEDVAVLLSGGVDSSVALRLALEAGARPHAFYLKIWLDDELAHLGECPWEEDMAYATAVCKQAGVPLTDVPFQRAYWDEVVAYTVREARLGRTPNPDVMCNSRIKFGAFYERIGRDFDRVVTGHYARREMCEETGLAELWLSGDAWKDQTYFLAHLRQEQVKEAWFPLGALSKARVRELADGYDLPNKRRRDSQGICFLGKLKFEEFLGHHLGHEKGSLVEFESGREVGFHRGFWFYTVGQRRGVGLSGGPWYVVCKDVVRNVVYVSREYDGAQMERNRFDFEAALWIGGGWPDALAEVGARAELRVKTRHGPVFHEAVVTRVGDEVGRVELAERDKGLAAGQFAAFYDKQGRCLGSGVISSDVGLAEAPREIVRMDASSVRLQAHF